MRLHVGTSGFSYKEWKGPFYPEDLPAARMLSFYAERLPAVEVNNTFYRMPTGEQLERWAADVPAGFVFVLKAPRAITHRARLAEVDEAVLRLWEASAALGEHRGPLLFQLPPSLKKDLPRLRDFLDGLPEGLRAALEFRHASWHDEEVREALRAAGAALCAADVDGQGDPALEATAPWGYLRLRRSSYSREALARWAERIGEIPWEETFVFFKHEDAATAPRMALELAELAGGR